MVDGIQEAVLAELPSRWNPVLKLHTYMRTEFMLRQIENPRKWHGFNCQCFLVI
jgi:hypothetical protein